MKKEFYRFRSINNLIGEFSELEMQSTYFAAPELLNDPLEGFRDVFWDGDIIVWKNLFRHYLLCLERLCSLLVISGEDSPILAEHMPIFSGEDNFPTGMYKEIFSKTSEIFFKNKYLSKLICQIANRSTPVRKDELSFYLSNIHNFALDTINQSYETHKIIPFQQKKGRKSEGLIKDLIKSNIIDLLEKGLNEGENNENITSAIFSAQKNSQASSPRHWLRLE